MIGLKVIFSLDFNKKKVANNLHQTEILRKHTYVHRIYLSWTEQYSCPILIGLYDDLKYSPYILQSEQSNTSG